MTIHAAHNSLIAAYARMAAVLHSVADVHEELLGAAAKPEPATKKPAKPRKPTKPKISPEVNGRLVDVSGAGF